MKKHYIAYFFALLLISCSENESTTDSITENTIVGKWYFSGNFNLGNLPFDDCIKKSFLVIDNDLNVSETRYEFVKNECKIIRETPNSVKLIRTTNNRYGVKGDPSEYVLIENKTTFKLKSKNREGYTLWVKR